MSRKIVGLTAAVGLLLISYIASNTLLGRVTPSLSLSSSESQEISFSTSNSYDSLESSTLYPWDHYAEPHTVTKLSADMGTYDTSGGSFTWTIEYQHKGDPVQLLLLEGEGQELEATFTHPGQPYTVTIEYSDDSVTTSNSFTLMCKYVRRDIRALSDDDRNAFLDAMEVVFHLDLDDGQALYGEDFRNVQYFGVKHIALDGCNPFHGATSFLTAHAAFTLEFDKSLQTVDPSVTTPYWDYTYDHNVYGHNWVNSEIFDSSWFGTAEPDNTDYVLTESRFAYTAIPTSYDRPVHNSFGRVTSRVNNDKSEYITRSHSVCGLPSDMPLPSCQAVLGCLTETSLHDAHTCLELDVHSYFHLMIGGAWDCEYSGKDAMEAFPQLSSTIQLVMFNSMNLWAAMEAAGYLICPEVCSEDTAFEDCLCSCPLVDELNTEGDLNPGEVTSLLVDGSLVPWLEIFLDDVTVDYTDDSITIANLTDSENDDFLKWLLLFVCHPGKTGSMGTNGAPYDPIFWPIHPTFDRILAFFRLAPAFDDFNFTWSSDGTCYGNGYDDLQPFSNLFNEETPEHYYSNAELMLLFDPSNEELPYMYDSFHWTNCDDFAVDENDLYMQEILRESKGILPKRGEKAP